MYHSSPIAPIQSPQTVIDRGDHMYTYAIIILKDDQTPHLMYLEQSLKTAQASAEYLKAVGYRVSIYVKRQEYIPKQP